MSLAPSDGVAPGPTRIRIDSRPRTFPDLRELWRYRHLVTLLGRRDITARYRQTIVGPLWILAGPLVSAGLFSFVFGSVAELPTPGNVPYFVFSYAGLLTWNFFSGAMSSATSSVGGNANLITKIYFPRLVLPASAIMTVAVNTGISFVVMLVLLLVSGVGISVQILLLPLWLLVALTLALGVAFILGPLAVSYRDVNYIVPLATQLLLYLSPVAYSAENVPDRFQTLILLNPLTSIIEGARWSLLGHGTLTPWAVAYSVVVSVVMLVIGLAVFANREAVFADVI